MPRIFRVNNDNPLIAGLAGASQSAATAMKFRSQRLAEERANRAQALKEKALDAQIEQAQSAQDRINSERQAAGELNSGLLGSMQDRIAPPGSLGMDQQGPLPEGADRINEQRMALGDRLGRARELLPKLSPAAQDRFMARISQEERQRVMDDAFQETAQSLKDALDDGVFGDNQGAAQELAKLLQQEQAAGGRPDKIHDLIAKQTKAFEEDAVVQGEWDDEITRANKLLEVTKDRGIRMDLQREIVKANKTSSRRKGDPERFRNTINSIALGDNAGSALRNEAMRGTQFDQVTFLENEQKLAAEVSRREAQDPNFFANSLRDQAASEQAARGGTAAAPPQVAAQAPGQAAPAPARTARRGGTSSFADTPKAKQTQLVAKIRKLVSGKAMKMGKGAFGIDAPFIVPNTREELKAIFDAAGVDIASFPPDMLKEIVDTGGLKKEFGDVFN